MFSLCILSVAAFGLAAGAAVNSELRTLNTTGPTATTKNGTYYGIHQSNWNQDFFQGIPFAQAPVGDLRFRDPQSLNTSWNGERNATDLGYLCYGYGSTQQVLGEYVSEDCLTLNVYRSANATGDQLPVAVYFHGGLFRHGTGRDPRYNMTAILANADRNGKPFIGVTFNYRLSYFGFMYGKEVASEGVANLGLKDQRMALRWINENIAAFGGDPDKVTIWGQEAGAFSVGLQMLAYGGRDDGLFRGAISQSGSPLLMWPSKTADEWQPLYDSFVSQTNCTRAADTLACLRAVPADTLSGLFENATESVTENHDNPVVDGDFIREIGSKALEAGHFVKVPYLVGTTADEGTWSYYGVENINTTNQFLRMVEYDGLSNATANKLAALYPDDPAQGIPSTLVGRPGNETGLGYQWKRSSAYNGDKVMQAGRRLAAQQWAQHDVPVYSYQYDVLFHAKWWQYGAQEQDDVAFVFHNVTLSESLSPEDQADQKSTFEPLSQIMTSMWISFFSDLDPNNHGQNITIKWPEYSLDVPQSMVFDVNATQLVRVSNDSFREKPIAYWMDLFTSEMPR
ncbi:triacylglycerol lipase [Phyllosticta capitalensis]